MPAAATAAANQTAAGAATVSRDPAWPATTTYYDAAPSPAPPALQGPLTAFESFLLLIGGGLFEGLYDLVS